MPEQVLGVILLFALGGWPFVIAGWVFRRLFPGTTPPPTADGERKLVRVVHPVPDVRPRAVPVAAAARENIQQLSPAQRCRLSEWIATWSRLRVDDGIADHWSIEDAILRRYEGVDRQHVRFQWVPFGRGRVRGRRASPAAPHPRAAPADARAMGGASATRVDP